VKLRDLKGKKFGRLKVISLVGRGSGGQAVWLCRCACGTEKEILAGNLGKSSNSCGCLRREQKSAQLATHSMSKTHIYRIYSHMLERCADPNRPRYGGRGIKVCKRWRGPRGFENFYKKMGDQPFEGATLDRIDNEGDYTPNNTRWATQTEQHRNKSSNREVTYQGQTMCISAWAERTGLHKATIRSRLEAGWSIKKALKSPARSRRW
jgi:hypothetical protein